MPMDFESPQLATSAGPRGLRRYLGPKRLLLLSVYLMMGGLIWYLWRTGTLTHQSVIGFIGANPVSAPVVFILVYATVVVFMIPSLPLNLGAGYLWGPFLGCLYTTLGFTIGSVVAFSLARSTFGQPFTRTFDNTLLNWLSRQTSDKGWKVVAFVRLNPAFPSGPVNYLLGMTSISLVDFAWASMIFPLPLSYGIAYLGKSAGGLILDGDSQRLVQLIVAASVLFCVMYAGRIAYRQYLGKTL